MNSQRRLQARINELHLRWGRLSQKLQGLQQQRDLETRFEEKLRLDSLIRETEAEREQVEAELQRFEAEHTPLKLADTMKPVMPSTPIEIFYSYAHEDEILRNELEKHLKLLKREGVISNWHDRQIGAGTEWANQIDAHLESARIILLLISADFIASDYCWDVEMKRAMERHECGAARVIPVILRPIDDWRNAPFSKLQALPKDARPVTTWPNQDEAFVDIARGIRAVAKELPNIGC